MTNLEFLQALFGDDYIWAHVTAFPDDPSNISNDNRMRCWAGDYWCRTNLPPDTNQYFTISTFFQAEDGKARRRKSLFRATHVIVADDVREKLDVEMVKLLPEPTWKLETSPGSEQWGWILTHPCTDRNRVENLLDGLVAQGLAPAGKDPGMKGVTRYVRLPEGINTKASKVVDGFYPRCKMLEWNPGQTVSLEELAKPFNVNLDAERRETRVDGAADLPDHPLLDVDTINIKEVLSGGRFDITCPWVDGHTNAADDGSAIFTNSDGSIGFKCHHGSCEHRTGKDLLDFIEQNFPGFRSRLTAWQTEKSFANIMARQVDFMGVEAEPDFMGKPEPAADAGTAAGDGYQQLIDALKRIPHNSQQARELAHQILHAVDQLDTAARLVWWDEIRDHMQWTKAELKQIVEEQREQWYRPAAADLSFFDDYVFVQQQNQFYSPRTRVWLTPEGFQNAYAHVDNEARVTALVNGRCQKVDKLDYAPGYPRIFQEDGIVYLNGWTGNIHRGEPGEISRWLDHFKALGWEQHMDHMIRWMAFTLQFPERKINHILILGGGEGNGKDFLLYPLKKAMGADGQVIDGDVLLEGFSEHLLGTKYLHVNEADLGSRKEAEMIHNKIKPLAAAPPYHLRVNIKGIRPINVRNIVNVTMTTNSAVPIGVKQHSRRYYPVWTDVSIRDETGKVKQEWATYWKDRWNWIRDCEGWKAVVHYLMNVVDVSDFDPAKVPVQTDYMQQIMEASEDPVSSLIRIFTEEKLSLMAADIVTPVDIYNSLKGNNMLNLGIDIGRVPSTAVLGKIMKQSALGRSRRMADENNKQVRVWIIRDFEKYKWLSDRDLYILYQQQMKKVRANTKLVNTKKGGE